MPRYQEDIIMGRNGVTVPMPAELNDAIEAELGYGDSKAEWIRTAIKMRLEDEAGAMRRRAKRPLGTRGFR